MKFSIFLTSKKPVFLKRLKDLTSLPIAHINMSFDGKIPLITFQEYENTETQCFGSETTNDFSFFSVVVEELSALGISYTIEGASDIADMYKRYELSGKISKSIDILELLHEKFPDSEAWEEEIDGKQHFFVKIDGKNVNALSVLDD